MGQQVIVTVTDDLDGSAADETVRFDLDGAGYEIDLNEKNAAALRKALGRYVAAARKPTPVRRRSSRSRATSFTQTDPKAVRAWLQEQGLEVSSRGRIPAEILDRYYAAGGT